MKMTLFISLDVTPQTGLRKPLEPRNPGVPLFRAEIQKLLCLNHISPNAE
jgi:hypothetical protein